MVEVNNPAHVEHFQRADADEILVSSQLVSRLMARTSLYPGLAGLVTDIVSGGEGSELYRVSLPDEYVGLSVDELSAKLRLEHRATLLSVSRGGQSYVNPPEDFRLSNGDDLVVVAESLGHAGAAADGPRPDLRSERSPGDRDSSPDCRVPVPGTGDRGLRPADAAITTSEPPFQVTASVCAASRSVPTIRATTSSSGPALTIVSGPSSWVPTASTSGTSVSALPLPRDLGVGGPGLRAFPTLELVVDAGRAGEDRVGERAARRPGRRSRRTPSAARARSARWCRSGAPRRRRARRRGRSAAGTGSAALRPEQEALHPDLAGGVVEPERPDRLAVRRCRRTTDGSAASRPSARAWTGSGWRSGRRGPCARP